eukprot:10064619-Alexandrium_andersonii.AAC.1
MSSRRRPKRPNRRREGGVAPRTLPPGGSSGQSPQRAQPKRSWKRETSPTPQSLKRRPRKRLSLWARRMLRHSTSPWT